MVRLTNITHLKRKGYIWANFIATDRPCRSVIGGVGRKSHPKSLKNSSNLPRYSMITCTSDQVATSFVLFFDYRIDLPGFSKCVKFVPFHFNKLPKGRNSTYLEDPGRSIEVELPFFIPTETVEVFERWRWCWKVTRQLRLEIVQFFRKSIEGLDGWRSLLPGERKTHRHNTITRWWFQIFFFSPLLGEMIQFD